ncbi:protein-disulfide isomerase [Pseudomonas brassicacearum]|uniref:Protein-disulfide isomerase n=1 Tax=Pseudomonas brassicacearum TaxID=930166 RepID=A0A423HCH7_9PSED|nr:DsbA family protein [Pseudomonas brassicacearum]RON10876.1 protein-disulfide isomerase [Pseudomonas brassicacearum]
MSTTILHYIYDPLCGWCYGAKPLVQAAQAVLPVVAHGGGMMTGANRQTVSPQLRDYVMPHDRRIAEYTGQSFGEAYFEGLLRDHTAVFDSAPPIAAVLAAEQLAGRGLELLGRLQSAHYAEGRRIADEAVLLELAVSIGLEAESFKREFKDALANETQDHIKQSRALLAEVGGQGFPTLALEQDGQFTLVDIGPWLGKPEAFAAWLSQSVVTQPSDSASPVQACGLDGCAH